MKASSKRFRSSKWFERLVPLLLGVLLLGLAVTMAVVLLAVIGLMPGS